MRHAVEQEGVDKTSFKFDLLILNCLSEVPMETVMRQLRQAVVDKGVKVEDNDIRMFLGTQKDDGGQHMTYFGIGADQADVHQALDGLEVKLKIFGGNTVWHEQIIPAAKHLKKNDIAMGSIYRMPIGRSNSQVKADLERDVKGLTIKYIRRYVDAKTGRTKSTLQYIATNVGAETRAAPRDSCQG